MANSPPDTAERDTFGLLAVMEAIEERSNISQRELARTTGLNLKKVNFCLHKLAEKGYVKFERIRRNPDKRGYLYVLTAAGLKAKAQLTYNFVKFTFDYYTRVEEKLARVVTEMEAAGVGSLLLFGVSDAARILIGHVDPNRMKVRAILDDDFTGSEFHGVPVSKSDDFVPADFDGVLITALDDLEGAEGRLLELGVREERTWRLS